MRRLRDLIEVYKILSGKNYCINILPTGSIQSAYSEDTVGLWSLHIGTICHNMLLKLKLHLSTASSQDSKNTRESWTYKVASFTVGPSTFKFKFKFHAGFHDPEGVPIATNVILWLPAWLPVVLVIVRFSKAYDFIDTQLDFAYAFATILPIDLPSRSFKLIN